MANLNPEMLHDDPEGDGNLPEASSSDEEGDMPPSLPTLLKGLRLKHVPLGGPSFKWRQAVAPAVAAMRCVVAQHVPDVRTFPLTTACEHVVGMMRHYRGDAVADAIAAAFAAMRADEGGRAVLAVCDVARGWAWLDKDYFVAMADYPGLEEELQRRYWMKPFLPVLIATIRYYRALTADSKGAPAAEGEADGVAPMASGVPAAAAGGAPAATGGAGSV